MFFIPSHLDFFTIVSKNTKYLLWIQLPLVITPYKILNNHNNNNKTSNSAVTCSPHSHQPSSLAIFSSVTQTPLFSHIPIPHSSADINSLMDRLFYYESQCSASIMICFLSLSQKKSKSYCKNRGFNLSHFFYLSLPVSDTWSLSSASIR